MLIPVILCGGSGSRLWPMSRSFYPKQFLNLINDIESIFQQTISRLENLDDIKKIIVVCNEEHRFLVLEQTKKYSGYDFLIILEPAGKNTAPALAAASQFILAENPQAVILALPADHFIKDKMIFSSTINQAMPLANDNKIVTFGVTPSSGKTGYGYIEKGKQIAGHEAFEIKAFKEKPCEETAIEYYESERYSWNSGMFLFKAETYLSDLEKYAADIKKCCQEAVDNLSLDLEFIRLDRDIFLKCRSESIDYAIMEHTQQAVVFPLEIEWSDIGSWSSLADVSGPDADGNVQSGDSILVDTKKLIYKEFFKAGHCGGSR